MEVFNKYILCVWFCCVIYMVSLLRAQELNDESTSFHSTKDDDVYSDIGQTDTSKLDTDGIIHLNTDGSVVASDERLDNRDKDDATRRIDDNDESYTTLQGVHVDDEQAMSMTSSSSSLKNEPVTSSTKTLSEIPSKSNSEPFPPYIFYPLKQDMIIVLNQKSKNFQVVCEAKGNPTPTFKWFRNGVLIDGSEQYYSAYENGTLIFNDFSSRENGLYHCHATNKYGTSVSVKVPIMAEKEPTQLPANETGSQNKEASVGQVFSFQCSETPTTIPEYTRTWYYESHESRTQVNLTDRIGTDLKGNLRFAYLQLEDSNSYVCALAPVVAGNKGVIRFYNSVNLKVQPANNHNFTPRLVYASPTVQAVIGQKAILECFFTAKPPAKITWRKTGVGRDIAANDTHYATKDYGRRLYIMEVKESDVGSYRCTGISEYGHDSGTVNVNVTGPPQMTSEGLYSKTEHEEEDTKLKCKAKGVNQQSISSPEWFRNGEPLDEDNFPDPERYMFNQDRTELTIQRLNKDVDIACFQCNVSNSEGYLFYDGYLNVTDPKPPKPEPQVTPKESGMPLWWVGIVVGLLFILIAIIIIVVIIKCYYPGDTYLLEKAEIKHHLNPQQDLLDQSFQEV